MSVLSLDEIIQSWAYDNIGNCTVVDEEIRYMWAVDHYGDFFRGGEWDPSKIPDIDDNGVTRNQLHKWTHRYWAEEERAMIIKYLDEDKSRRGSNRHTRGADSK